MYILKLFLKAVSLDFITWGTNLQSTLLLIQCTCPNFFFLYAENISGILQCGCCCCFQYFKKKFFYSSMLVKHFLYGRGHWDKGPFSIICYTIIFFIVFSANSFTISMLQIKLLTHCLSKINKFLIHFPIYIKETNQHLEHF